MNSILHPNSELLVASIEQKANALKLVPFNNAVNYAKNKRYLPLALIPILIFLLVYASGNTKIISQSLNRVVHYTKLFSPPAPFEFVILNSKLETKQNEDFILKVITKGNIVPENAMIFISNESYFLENNKPGEFQFKISKPNENVLFHVEANGVSSSDYELKVLKVPSISNFEMVLNFPSYLNKKSEIIKGTGNAILPEGTRVTWKLQTQATQSVDFYQDNSKTSFNESLPIFSLSKSIFKNTNYQIITSNIALKNYEKLNYQINVINDQFPTINAGFAPDSLKTNKNFILGQIADDYGLQKLQIVYYEKGKLYSSKRALIPLKAKSFDQFVFSFPANLAVTQGVIYEYYFEVFDNDALHNFKSSKSSVFSNRIATDEEKADQLLQQQNDNINGLQKSLKTQDKQLSDIDKLQKLGKEKDVFEFKEQQNVNDFINRQKKQDEMMKEFADKMKDNLDKFKSTPKDEFKEELKKRLEDANKDLDKNQKLLDELKELNDKIKKEDLLEKLDKFKNNSKNQTKNLQQLVELTKKYYVEKKAEQLADKLDKLSDKQDILSEDIKDNSLKKQDEINKEFDAIKEELKDLKQDNKELKSPVDLPNDQEKEKSIDDDLNKASDELKNNNASKAKPKQKSAAQKMKSMSQKMGQSLESSEQEQLEEDVKMLRQILDNLLAFSNSQEDLMRQFKNCKQGSPSFNKNLKAQQNLKLQFKHVDDSLFAMSLRNPKIAENVTKEIGNIQYNIDNSIDNFTNSNFSKGLSHQQYTISSTNILGDFLSEILSNMQLSLSGSPGGKPKPGQGSGMQLPDIIKRQKGLGEKMKSGMAQSESPGEKPGEKSGLGKEGNSGEKSKSGKSNSKENGEGNEGDAKAIIEIYKEQKQLRESLQNELNKQGIGNQGQNAVEQMKQLEKQLLNKGFNNEVLQRMQNLKQELLKLETAIREQGQESKKQSESTNKEFQNNAVSLPKSLIEYLNSIEILNRQSLPLRTNFDRKVQEYFKK